MFDDIKKIVFCLGVLLLDTDHDGTTDEEIEAAGKKLIEILDEPGGIEVSGIAREAVGFLLPIVLRIVVRQLQKNGLLKK